MRRRLASWAGAACAFAVLAIAMPTTALAHDGEDHSGTGTVATSQLRSSPVSRTYTGWAWVNGLNCDRPSCANTTNGIPLGVWRWTNSGWVAGRVWHGQQVYTAPYAAGWRWIWTAATGWAAIDERRVWYAWRA
jgi:hypothetical protein